MTTAAGSIPPWSDLIAEMGSLRQRVNQIEPIYPFTIPHLAATPEQIGAAEARLGHALDPQHREFLSHGNGWPDFYLGSDLLSTDDLGQGPAWDRISENLDALYGSLDTPGACPPRSQIYPISHNAEEASIFAIWTHGPATNGGHPVLWLPWLDTEPYDNFVEFFAMTHQEYDKELQTES